MSALERGGKNELLVSVKHSEKKLLPSCARPSSEWGRPPLGLERPDSEGPSVRSDGHLCS